MYKMRTLAQVAISGGQPKGNRNSKLKKKKSKGVKISN